MKKLFAIGVAALVLATVSAKAQVVTNQVPNELTNAPSTFFSTVGNYFSTSNPNLPIKGKAEIAIGMAYQAGVNIASDLDARYKINVSTNSGVILESVTRNAGVAGVIVSEEAGVGYFYIPTSTPDIELSAGLLGGWNFNNEHAALTAYLDVRKSLTENTFAGVRCGYEYTGAVGSQNVPVLTAYTGFTF